MTIYIIKNENNEEVKRIVASPEFVEAHHAGRYEKVVFETSPLPVESSERRWRDSELDATDKAAQTPDWPNRDNILAYRTALRDWPSAASFPATRPALGE